MRCTSCASLPEVDLRTQAQKRLSNTRTFTKQTSHHILSSTFTFLINPPLLPSTLRATSSLSHSLQCHARVLPTQSSVISSVIVVRQPLPSTPFHLSFIS